MRTQFTVMLLVSIAGLCTAQDPPPRPWDFWINPADFQPALDANRAKWAAQNIEAYKFKQTRSCFCPKEFRGPFDVVVFRERVISVLYSPDSGLTGEPSYKDGLLTVEGVFDKVQEILNMDPLPSRLTVSYDAELGYITNFRVDPKANTADDEKGASFGELESIFRLPSGFPGPQFDLSGK